VGNCRRFFYFCKKIVLHPSDIISIRSYKEFHQKALKVFRYQYEFNTVYQSFCKHLNILPTDVKKLTDIPFLPVEFFKSHDVICGSENPQITFTSSGTTGAVTSKHLVNDVSYYEMSFKAAFSLFYGNVEDYIVLALLPSYLEREGSSLVYMANELIQSSNREESGFYLNQYETLRNQLLKWDAENQQILLIGVTYALLDLIELGTMQLRNTIVMETGGMKGRRREMIREELHQILKSGFGVQQIHSEYGMTELLSQAYSFGEGRFECPPWMQILVRDTEDPFTYVEDGKTGGINIIDLANMHSCSFISTQDLGKKYADDSFEVLGRFDHSDVRGCNLMLW
jgi:phenylacetate-coenzyme A ligase PaaK-like adenylate-forming protein